MSGINQVTIVGRLGNDPEVRQLPNGGEVCNISIATSETWKDKNTGQKQEKTEWHRCVAFNKQAEIIGQYFKKGSQIGITGSLQTRMWEMEGEKRYSTEIKIRDFTFLDSRQDSNSGGSSPQGGTPPEDFDDSVPF